jgi:hypothetical protein
MRFGVLIMLTRLVHHIRPLLCQGLAPARSLRLVRNRGLRVS